MIKKLLYITFIDMDNIPTSGSSVRPQKILEAFKELNIQVKTLSGINNDISIRKKTVKEAKKILNEWKPDACYIEPPSGPMFYWGDVKLIKTMHKLKLPISIFYRDAYWKYPDFYLSKNISLIDRFKQLVIKNMQIVQWNVFKNNIDIIYFPSLTMAKEFDCSRKDALPPGAFYASVDEKNYNVTPLQAIFVGGASKNYGTYLTIEAFEKVNCDGIKAKLLYICPKEQWESLGIDEKKYAKWLDVVHTSGDNNLIKYYEKADIAILTAPRTFYRDFAVPIKLFEYMSYLKPMLVTNCIETERVVIDNKVGWVVEDSVDSIADKIISLSDSFDEINEVKSNMKNARECNLWKVRAQKVLEDLENNI